MLYSQNELKFNLMAIVPNRKERAEAKEKILTAKRQYICKLLGDQTNQSSNQDVEVNIV